MNPWSNIEISFNDPEIIEIDEFEKSLGDMSVNVRQIRELITRFEVCHFKYQNHIKNIIKSVSDLHPVVEPSKIGSNHIHKGENIWMNDKTKRSLLGQQYLWALIDWLGDNLQVKDSVYYNHELSRQIAKRLGNKNPDKERLVRLLIARLTWNWKSYEELKQGKEYKKLELQACRIDICHYTFPKNLDLLLQGIGEMKPVEAFEGCGSLDSGIKTYIEKEFSNLSDLLKSITGVSIPDKNELIKAWLISCFLKTLKEQVGLTKPIPIY